MASQTIAESIVESTILLWLEAPGYNVPPKFASGEFRVRNARQTAKALA